MKNASLIVIFLCMVGCVSQPAKKPAFDATLSGRYATISLDFPASPSSSYSHVYPSYDTYLFGFDSFQLSIDIRPGTPDIKSSPEETLRSKALSLKDRFIDPKGKIVGYAQAGELAIPIEAWTGVDGDYLSATIPAKRGYISFSLTKNLIIATQLATLDS